MLHFLFQLSDFSTFSCLFLAFFCVLCYCFAVRDGKNVLMMEKNPKFTRNAKKNFKNVVQFSKCKC